MDIRQIGRQNNLWKINLINSEPNTGLLGDFLPQCAFITSLQRGGSESCVFGSGFATKPSFFGTTFYGTKSWWPTFPGNEHLDMELIGGWNPDDNFPPLEGGRGWNSCSPRPPSLSLALLFGSVLTPLFVLLPRRAKSLVMAGLPLSLERIVPSDVGSSLLLPVWTCKKSGVPSLCGNKARMLARSVITCSSSPPSAEL